MSRRTIRDYISAAFLARDKATVDTIIKDAEKAIPDGDDEDHKEPDGDEGDTHVHLHLSKNGDASSTGDAVIDGRFAKIEDGLRSLDKKVSKFFDALPPEFLKGKKDGDDDKKDDDTKDTKDVGELPGEEGAMTAQALTTAEPDLMEADPALKTGPSKMGDAAYVEAVGKQLVKLIKDTRARAEVLVPGIKFATFDAAPAKAETAKLLCGMRRDTLLKAAATDAGKRVLGRYTADAITGLDCGGVRLAFLDASDRMRDVNNGQGRNFQSGATVDARSFRQGQSAVLKSINEKNHAHWEKQMGRLN